MRQAKDVANFMDGHLEGTQTIAAGTIPLQRADLCLVRRRGVMLRMGALSREEVGSSLEQPWLSGLWAHVTALPAAPQAR